MPFSLFITTLQCVVVVFVRCKRSSGTFTLFYYSLQKCFKVREKRKKGKINRNQEK